MPITSRSSGKDEREALFPTALLPLFSDVFVASFDLCEEYVARTALSVLQATGLHQACSEAATVEQAVARAKLIEHIARVPAQWLLRNAAARGWLEKTGKSNGEPLYRAARPLPTLDAHEIRQAQEALDPRCLPSYEIAALAAMHYPAVLRGQTSGEQALFGAEGISMWLQYFSNDNPLYAISNAVGAHAAQQALAGSSLAILEIGGGLGSGAAALLDLLDQTASTHRGIEAYRFTEISPLLLRRAQRMLSARHPACPFSFSALDIDRSFAEQGVAYATYSLVYGVNVLHVARDLAATLGQLRETLVPGGMLVMSECMRPFTGEPVHTEFVFNLLESFRDPVLVPDWRPNGGFLTPEQWSAALAANGFADIHIFPDISAIRNAYPGMSVAAVVARRS